ncbi:DNA internalization-related competence protein ComEC/Rec2 [Fictibacillus sp. B-59209]|uniref:DNA internalization-related competence protein ComEC/Rec2 n=1 Tax=Fictibacillus sp. B-59209 TaxID=3024873 RepID=UPI002E1A3763|nr:DNA internalization-related competence protein ComEC/Rec2 [Fictibacillus sp. B-59209]
MRAGYFYAISAAAGVFLSSYHYIWAIAGIALFYGKKGANTLTISFCLAVFVFFYAYYQFTDKQNVTKFSGDERTFTGTVMTIPEIDGDLLSFKLQTKHEKFVVHHIIPSHGMQKRLKQNLHQGMVCTFDGELIVPEGRGNFAGMDYALYLKRQRIHWSIKAAHLSVSACRDKPPDLLGHAAAFREKGIRLIEKVVEEDVSGIINALVFGYREKIPVDIDEAYQRMGLSHLLAVSGFNVAIIMGMLFAGSLRMGITRERAALGIASVLPLYVVMTGSEASIVRAGIMGMALLMFRRYRRRIHPLSPVSGVCLLMLLMNPYYVFQLGFQLSFMNVFALLISSRLIFSRYTSYLAQALVTTLICQIVSFPIIIYHFYETSLWSVPLNLLFIPLLSFVVLPLACLSLPILFLSLNAAKIILYLPVILMKFTNSILLHAQKNNLDFVFGQPPAYLIPIYYFGIFNLFVQWERYGCHKRLLYPASFLVLAGVFHWNVHSLDPSSTITYLNVGQGDSTLIELPFRQGVYLIDTGGTLNFEKEEWRKRKVDYNFTKEVVLPGLKARGIRKIDKLILTHGDMDHIGGAETVLSGVRIGELLYPKGTIDGVLETSVLNHAASLDIPIRVTQRGQRWSVGDHLFYVLSPYGDETESNAQSIVLLAKMKRFSFLFTGDLEEEGEKRILSGNIPLKADFLKAGHHGSKTSSSQAFIDAVDPIYAFISAGKNNRYGHPHPDVVSRFKKNAAVILRTDQLGDIEIQMLGHKLKIHHSVTGSK